MQMPGQIDLARRERRRRDDWVACLHQTVEAWASSGLEYGRADCALLAARCVDAMTGSRWERDLQLEYRDARSALRLMRSAGGLEAAVTARLGVPVPPLAARRGDVCLIPGRGGYALGVCMGGTIAAMHSDGIRYVPLAAALKAWPV